MAERLAVDNLRWRVAERDDYETLKVKKLNLAQAVPERFPVRIRVDG